MHLPAVLRVFGVLLMYFSLTMIPPLAISIGYGDGGHIAFGLSFFIILFSGFICWFFCRHAKNELSIRDGFLVVAVFWLMLSIFGAVPLMVAQHPSLSFTNALFETVSGITTTGASVLTRVEYLPHAIQFYRQQLQFFGGMGIVVLAVAILPMLRIGGLQLYRAEIPGPTKDAKIAPRLAQTAKTLWFIYAGLTAICAFAYWANGMTVFNAIGESFATLSTGGFTMHDASFAYYNNPKIYLLATVFMFLGGTNFTLHFVAMTRKSLNFYWRDSEFRIYLGILAITILVTASMLTMYHTFPDSFQVALNTIFTVVSIVTTTGFIITPFSNWPTFVPLMLLLMGMIGACAASTSGGLKIIRVILLFKQGTREMHRLIHPNAVMPLKLGNKVLPDELLQGVWGYIGLYLLLFILLTFALMATGLDLETAESAVISCMSNVGIGLGTVATSFDVLVDPAKWILTFAMLIGRLELFTLLVLFSADFWRR